VKGAKKKIQGKKSVYNRGKIKNSTIKTVGNGEKGVFGNQKGNGGSLVVEECCDGQGLGKRKNRGRESKKKKKEKKIKTGKTTEEELNDRHRQWEKSRAGGELLQNNRKRK